MGRLLITDVEHLQLLRRRSESIKKLMHEYLGEAPPEKLVPGREPVQKVTVKWYRPLVVSKYHWPSTHNGSSKSCFPEETLHIKANEDDTGLLS